MIQAVSLAARNISRGGGVRRRVWADLRAGSGERGVYSLGVPSGGIVIVMETPPQSHSTTADAGAATDLSPAEELPGLYRAILDRVAELEALGQRAEALRIRHAATESYSGSWDASCRRTLLAQLRRADRSLQGESQQRTWAWRRRSAAAR